MQLILNEPSLKDFTVEELDLLLNGQWLLWLGGCLEAWQVLLD